MEADPPWDVPGVLELFTASFGPAICVQIAYIQMVTGREITEADTEPLSWAIWNLCQGISSVDALGAELQLQAFARQLITWLSDYDALLTPALAEPPVTHGTIDPCAADPMASFARSGTFTPYTAMFNVSGQPAITIPLLRREDGLDLPLSVQLVGQPAREGELLALSAQLEAARPWAEHCPALATA